MQITHSEQTTLNPFCFALKSGSYLINLAFIFNNTISLKKSIKKSKCSILHF